jgi:PadR family transcriptional regulator, regulatory protein PadR
MPGQGRGFGRGRGHGGGRGRGGERSLLATRLVEPALLVLLSQGNLHGYTLLERVEALGLVALQPSMVYRILREMEEAGWVSSIWDREQTQGPPRRVYTLTEEGLAALREWERHLEQTQGLISRLLEKMQNQR